MGLGKKLGKSEIGFILLARPLYAPAYTYDNCIGKIWMVEVGGYDNAPSGKIGLADPSGSQGGYYDNR